MAYNVVGYKVKWSSETHKGVVIVRYINPIKPPDNNKENAYFYTENPEEVSMLVDLLRNETPIVYDGATDELKLGDWETIGEEES